MTESSTGGTIVVVEPNLVEAGRMCRALQCSGRLQAFVDLFTRPMAQWPTRPPLASSRSVIAVGSLRELHECDLAPVVTVITAVSLPDGNNLDVIAYVHGMHRSLPVIIVGDREEATMMIEGVRAGATDFLVRTREYLNVLSICVDKCLEHHRIRMENEELREKVDQANARLQIANEQLKAAAHTDELTGMSNRRCFRDALDREWQATLRAGRPLSCLMIDLDGFKEINDAHGHDRGDQVLRRTARVIESACRSVDIAARLGGDEFCILLPDTRMEEARLVAERIRAEFVAAMSRDERLSSVNISIGVADNIAGRPASAKELVRRADEALYRAKADGRGRVVVGASERDLVPRSLDR